MRSSRNLFTVTLLMGSLILLAACGGGTDMKNVPIPLPVTVSVSAAHSTVLIPGTVQLTATVTNGTTNGVTWTVSPSNLGSVSTAGVFTPTHAGTATITATSTDDTSKSGKTTITVTAPAPAFAGTPGTAVEAGGTYTYTAAATDPVETGTVTLELTTAPEGAEFNAETGEITWTPVTEQNRLPNAFVVTATTSHGGVSTQSWTVYPSGTITGSYIDKFWTADGQSTDVPNDLSYWYIAAFVPQADGSVVEFDGTGNMDGTFTIDGVPGGKVWLMLYDDGDTMDYPEFYFTDSSTFDFGSDYIGRPPVSEPILTVRPNYVTPPGSYISTSFSWNLTGLTPYCCYYPQAISPNAGFFHEANYYISGSTFQYDEGSYNVRPIQEGDDTYVIQRNAVTYSDVFDVYAITNALASNTIVTVPNGVTSIAGDMSASPVKSFSLSISGSAWNDMMVNGGAGVTMPDDFFGMIGTLPYVTDKFAMPQYYDYYMSDLAASAKRPSPQVSVGGPGNMPPMMNLADIWYEGKTDQELGSFRYADPYPSSWKRLFAAQQLGHSPASLPGTGETNMIPVGGSFIIDSLPTASIAPLMSAIKNPKINGLDFFTAATSEVTALGLNVTWSAPTGLAPKAYEVGVLTNSYDIACGNVDLCMSASFFYTTDTSITIPVDFLSDGTSYIFYVRAIADGRADFTTSPWRSGFPMADAAVVSAPITLKLNTPPTPETAARFKALMAKTVSAKTTTGTKKLELRRLHSMAPLGSHKK